MTGRTTPELQLITRDGQPAQGPSGTVPFVSGSSTEGLPMTQDNLRKALETAEATLHGENWFLETVRAQLEKVAPLSEFPAVSGGNGHDHLMHLTQFLFFLRALDCTDADQVEAFIDSHNSRIEARLRDPGFSKSRKEFTKALFRPERKAKVLDTIRTLREPVFAIYEYAHLMIDEMSPKTTEKLIEDLRFGGLLIRRTDYRLVADQKRNLISSTGFLERTYMTSLLMQRRKLAMGLSDQEFQLAQRP